MASIGALLLGLIILAPVLAALEWAVRRIRRGFWPKAEGK